MTEPSKSPRLAGPGDIARLVTGAGVRHEWPPPGTTVVPIAAPEPWVVVMGEPSDGAPGDWYVTDLATVTGLNELGALAYVANLLTDGANPVLSFAGSASHWPVIYEYGGGSAVRWVSATVRGELGGTEQFQFGMNFGNPGADPDPNEAECLAAAEDLAGIVQSALATAHFGGHTMGGDLPSSVVFTEVGLVVKEQTSGTASDGTGGDLTQKFDTQWFAYPVGGKPTGAGTSASLPFEVSTAVTLQTDKRGPSGRGRLYLPPLHVNCIAAGGVFANFVPDVCGKFVGEIFDEFSAAKGWVPVVVSRRRIVLNEVKAISVGIVPDSQRRRRRNQDEARQEVWTPAP